MLAMVVQTFHKSQLYGGRGRLTGEFELSLSTLWVSGQPVFLRLCLNKIKFLLLLRKKIRSVIGNYIDRESRQLERYTEADLLSLNIICK